MEVEKKSCNKPAISLTDGLRFAYPTAIKLQSHWKEVSLQVLLKTVEVEEVGFNFQGEDDR